MPPTSSADTIPRPVRSGGVSAAARRSRRRRRSSRTASSSSRAAVRRSVRSSRSVLAREARSRCRKERAPTPRWPGARPGAAPTCRRRWPIATACTCSATRDLLDAYTVTTGAEIYRQRIPHSGSGFSASPVAADGKIYLSSEDGDIFVVAAGENFAVTGRFPMGEPLMATPAIADGTIYVRGQRQLVAIGTKAGAGSHDDESRPAR